MSEDQLRVDPEALRTFANQLGTEAGELSALGAGDAFTTAASALPGTEFGAAARQSDDIVGRCLSRMGERLTTVADNMDNAAGVFELTEAEFARTLATIGLRLP
ncbi:ESX-1 secretion-associated protein [Nocardia higoensis]|uniref:ESX-1 secretion-associated protein n=1 Tax=Nocardia higoensis TaxID=228599 RepID=A0ABS0DB00_9NOCA|nr:type VII secretion target [Nocardia higoensis]MBF6355644.1 ESX-1 secretion-associated protein [Nocardia higoensis]